MTLTNSPTHAADDPIISSEIRGSEKSCSKRDYSQSIKEIRSQVEIQVAENPELYDADDLTKVFKNDFYVIRFLRWCKGDIKKSLNMLLKCFQWRKSSGLIYRKPSDFPSEFYSSGGMFKYEPDRTGRPTLYMRAKFMRKTVELDAPFQDFMAYKINEIDEACGNMMSWTIVFDCAEIGWANVHLDMLRFLISTISNYFPFGVRRIIILDTPWILSTIRRMVFAMLPEEAQKIAIFTTRKNLHEHIDPENTPDFANGTCKVPYNQVPLGSKPFDQLTDDFYNLSQKQLSKLRDLYKSILS